MESRFESELVSWCENRGYIHRDDEGITCNLPGDANVRLRDEGVSEPRLEVTNTYGGKIPASQTLKDLEDRGDTLHIKDSDGSYEFKVYEDEEVYYESGR